ncbi:MAG: hypothetical protein LIR31_03770 [Bacteroidota bacterium]|nr:hypothetical protein [Bacteroidota bacterium]
MEEVIADPYSGICRLGTREDKRLGLFKSFLCTSNLSIEITGDAAFTSTAFIFETVMTDADKVSSDSLAGGSEGTDIKTTLIAASKLIMAQN